MQLCAIMHNEAVILVLKYAPVYCICTFMVGTRRYSSPSESYGKNRLSVNTLKNQGHAGAGRPVLARRAGNSPGDRRCCCGTCLFVLAAIRFSLEHSGAEVSAPIHLDSKRLGAERFIPFSNFKLMTEDPCFFFNFLESI